MPRWPLPLAWVPGLHFQTWRASNPEHCAPGRGEEGDNTAAGTPPPKPRLVALVCGKSCGSLAGNRSWQRVSGSDGDSGPRPRTSLGSADLAQLGGSLGLVARKEGVGVLEAAAEGEVGALGVGAEAAHLVLTVGKDLGHGGRGVGAGLRRGADRGLAAGPAQQESRRKDEVMQHPGLRIQAGPPPPRLRLPGRWAGGGGGGGGGDRAGAGGGEGGGGGRGECGMTMSARLPQSAAGGAQWRRGGHRPAERGGAGVLECAGFSGEGRERQWEGPAQWRKWRLGEWCRIWRGAAGWSWGWSARSEPGPGGMRGGSSMESPEPSKWHQGIGGQVRPEGGGRAGIRVAGH